MNLDKTSDSGNHAFCSSKTGLQIDLYNAVTACYTFWTLVSSLDRFQDAGFKCLFDPINNAVSFYVKLN